MIKVGFLPLYDIYRPSSRYRVFQFLEPLRELGFSCQVLDAPQLNLAKRVKYIPRLLRFAVHQDILFIQKRMLPSALLSVVKKLCPKIVFDIDDAVYLRPQLRLKIDLMLKTATAVIAGNQTLAAYARQHNPHTYILPSAVDAAYYQPASEPRHPHDDRVIIGWIGSDPNRGDLDSLPAVFDWLGQKYGQKIVLQTVGSRPWEVKTSLPTEFIQWTLADSLSALQKFDIGIMPLDDTAWNQGKCGFKLIQYMAVGVTAVASPVGVNSEIVQHGINGYLAAAEEDWRTYLCQLIENNDQRRTMGQQARQRIERHYSLDAILPALTQLLRQVAA
jgi:glycosyltransferase involved in cell wall biosynthesis